MGARRRALGLHQRVIATKVSPKHLDEADVRAWIEASLKQLAMDYVNLSYTHWPNVEIPIEETISELNKLKDQVLIRAIGVSNFSLEQVKEAAPLGRRILETVDVDSWARTGECAKYTQ